ncbi:MFS transporter [Streptomyces cinereoruber]|uniref:MFS transporter n=1 Tax=Streptomyces cinereoruber TaxID=67260 RepID=A0AAV4KKT1_9ACTN|nr:putative MFS family arabinose efflux permease [Streptomyces cinereoruber]MBY8815643.1 MFS transporter [Streptomyces cinereoruber]NIH61408.1 putative MFS family arabinose efflux permease [Streptomyces cinereoruber]QEV32930.1 MFS transporter [Streptomyces cinereoruber]GGR35395.1 MFS transporter [Streptomyces cinereoruber]
MPRRTPLLRAPAPTPVSPREGRPGAVLAVTATATAVALMNYTAPMPTLPAVAAAFGTPPSAQAWLLNGTPLGLAALLLLAGGLADAYGRRRVFLLGTLVLGLTTALGALAGSTATFTAARIAQGAASAAVLAGSLGLLAHAYPAGRDRIRATGVWGASVSGGIALGPLLAGALSLADWRLAYGALGAGALVTAAAGARWLPRPAAAPGGTAAPRPDVTGALVLGLALAALLTALTLGRDGWLRPRVGLLLLASAALTALFAVVETRRKNPVIDLALLRRPAFLASTLGALFTGLAVIGLFSVVPTLLQAGIGMSALDTAWLFLLWSGTSFVAALQTRRLAARLSAAHQLTLGFVLSAAGVLTFLGSLENHAGAWRLLPGLLVAGVGSGLLNAALPRLAVDSVPPERAAMGSGANNTARYIGSSAGVALTLALTTAGPDAALAASAALALAGAALTLVLARR